MGNHSFHEAKRIHDFVDDSFAKVVFHLEKRYADEMMEGL